MLDQLRRRQARSDDQFPGSWSNTDGETTPVCRVVRTAEALECFAVAGADPHEDAVYNGLAFLRDAVRTLPYAPTGEATAGGAGAETRIINYGLFGLTAFRQPPNDREHSGAIKDCLNWLDDAAVRTSDDDGTGAGWPEFRDDLHVSVIATSMAVRGCDRAGTQVAKEPARLARSLAHRGRRALHALARHSDTDAWWPWSSAADGDNLSLAIPTATAYAVLALEGDSESRRLARAGAHWLRANPRKWHNQLAVDPHHGPPGMTYPTVAICLCAALIRRAWADSANPDLRPALTNLAKMWVASSSEWSATGRPRGVSTTADLHAANAIRAVRIAWRGFDLEQHILKKSPRSRDEEAALRQGTRVDRMTWDGTTISLYKSGGGRIASHAFHSNATQLRRVLEALIGAWKPSDSADFAARCVSHSDLFRLGVTRPADLVLQLENKLARLALEGKDEKPCALIERHRDPDDPRRKLFALYVRKLELKPPSP
jgi:hypothetical protein